MTVAKTNFANVMMPGAGGIRIPTEAYGSGGAGNPCGTFDIDKLVTHDYGAAAADWNLNPAETTGSIFLVSNASGAVNMIFPYLESGNPIFVSNQSGQALTVKIKGGGAGITIASTKRAILGMESTDIQRFTADT